MQEQFFREADFPRPVPGRFAVYRDIATGKRYHFQVSANADRKRFIDTIDGLLPALTRMTVGGVALEFVECRNAADIIVAEDVTAPVPDARLPMTLEELRRIENEEFMRQKAERHAAHLQFCVDSRPSERQNQLNEIAARRREEISASYKAWRESNRQVFSN